MGRAAQVLKSKVAVAIIAVVLIAAGVTAGILVHNKINGNVKVLTNSQNKITKISYDGKKGVDAYTLLKKHAKVQAKKYSFGYFITSINGVEGNGPKYWTFYVNGKEAAVGAEAYITKNSDRISWELK